MINYLKNIILIYFQIKNILKITFIILTICRRNEEFLHAFQYFNY